MGVPGRGWTRGHGIDTDVDRRCEHRAQQRAPRSVPRCACPDGRADPADRSSDRIADRRWHELHRDVYRVQRRAGDAGEGDLLAACWAGGFRAVASRRSAAALASAAGRSTRPRRDHVSALAAGSTRRTDRARDEGAGSRRRHGRRRHRGDDARRARCSISAASTGAGLVELALENALRRGLVDAKRSSIATVRRLSRSGRPGGPMLRQLLAARAPDRRPTESEMETLLAAGDPGARTSGAGPAARGLAGRAFARPGRRSRTRRRGSRSSTTRTSSTPVGAATARDRARRHELIAASWLPIDVGPADLRRGGTLTLRRDRPSPPRPPP